MPLTAAQDAEHWKLVAANLQERCNRLQAELDNARRGHDVLWRLWSEELPPPWRAWRVRRRERIAHDHAAGWAGAWKYTRPPEET